MEVLIAAGGTGGHIIPALALAEELKNRGIAAHDIAFLTSNRKIDHDLVKTSDYEVFRYDARGLSRSARGLVSALSSNLLASMRLYPSLKRWRPKVVVGFGGFYSLAGICIAKGFGAQILVVEQNSVLGTANTLAAPLANRIALALPIDAGVRRPKRITVTGNPLRREIRELADSPDPRETARQRLGVPPTTTLVVISTGSLGAASINSLVGELLIELDRRLGVEIMIAHFGGTKNSSQFVPDAQAVEMLSHITYRFEEYDPQLYLWLAAADVFLGRAGASTISELTAFGTPAVLVPLPGAPQNHQVRNAEYLKKAGAANVIEEGGLSVSRLTQDILELIEDPAHRMAMGKTSRSLGIVNAASQVADLVQGLNGARGWGH